MNSFPNYTANESHPRGIRPNEKRPAEASLAVSDLESLFLDFRSLADLVAKVVQLGATNGTVTDDLNLVDLGRVYREGTLDADGEADLADGEGLTARMTVTTDNVALEDLNTLAVAFLDAIVNLDGVTDVERSDFLDLLLFECANDIHVSFPFHFVCNDVA